MHFTLVLLLQLSFLLQPHPYLTVVYLSHYCPHRPEGRKHPLVLDRWRESSCHG